jgi:hypothetical protein
MKKLTRELRRLLQRSRATSLQKFGNYSREVLQADEWQIHTPAVHLAKGRVVFPVVCCLKSSAREAKMSWRLPFCREKLLLHGNCK